MKARKGHRGRLRDSRGRRRSSVAGSAGAGRRLVGELRLHRDGYGFVTHSGEGPAGDVFVPARFVGDALHTDIVEVCLAGEGARGKGPEGRISAVVERRVKRLVGRLSRHDNVFEVVVDDRRVRHRVLLPADRLAGAAVGDNVVVNIVTYPRGGEPMRGEVTEVLGKRGDPSTEAGAVIARHQLERGFPAAALREARAEARSEIGDEIEKRRDLRGVPFVTIDGETAMDFDDAVAVQREGDNIRLMVSIADVSHFVTPQGALDRAAFERATSVYFPGDCIPMLPEALSNGACSLRPGEERLTFTADMIIDPNGRRIEASFYRSVIKSAARLTYTQVKRLLVDDDPSVRSELGGVADELFSMRRCFDRLRAGRVSRGSIDFDLPEPEIMIDMQGRIEDIVRSERHVGHMMIEEFMIAANEAVAEFLTARRAGCLYRIHEAPPPEKISEFAVLVHNLGYGSRIKPGVLPGDLAKVVGWARGRPFERLVNHSLLRSMSQAVYSAENTGHYGLASRCYCHFTSPIRRYPDLVVHRLLSAALQGVQGQRRGSFGQKALKSQVSRLAETAEHCSRQERIAMEAEREMAKVYAALFMQKKVGLEFDGIISHVAKIGLFVELIDFFVEGVVHISTMMDDQYQLSEGNMAFIGKRKKRAFRVGDGVRVSVEDVDVAEREISFELV